MVAIVRGVMDEQNIYDNIIAACTTPCVRVEDSLGSDSHFSSDISFTEVPEAGAPGNAPEYATVRITIFSTKYSLN